MQNLIAVAIFWFLGSGIFGNAEVGSAEGPSREIAVSDLPELLNSKEGIEQLYKEFANIEGGKRKPWTVAELPGNLKKNRYGDLLAFDHSRVILTALPGDPHSDYINANYIDGQNFEKEYVATQGPLPNTVNDFWRMIWQLNATKIIMLANVIEHNETKVEKYWPEGSAMYGSIEVTKTAEYSILHLQHAMRIFSVKESGSEPRTVHQFHFTGWPDLGVPNDTFPVISLVHQARMYDPESKAPMVVHCSAGIGRTGTVILMDSMIQKAEAEDVVNFPKRLDHMRTLRPDVVEKKEQYVFAHRAVNDVFNTPGMKESLKEVEEEYRRLDPTYADGFDVRNDLAQVLEEMKWENALLEMLINSMMRQSGFDLEMDDEDTKVPAR